MGLGIKLMNHFLGNLAAGAVSALMEADTVAAEARKAEAEAKMKAYEIQQKQLDEASKQRRAMEETDRLKAQAAADKAEVQKKLYDDNYFNTLQAGIALSWYIAGIDGTISKEEADMISKRIQNIRSTSTIPAKYRDSIMSMETYRSMTFDEIKVYLDRVDKNSLVSMTLRTEYLAGLNGVTTEERSAMDGIKLYVEQRTGYHFKDLHYMPLSVNMICPTCGGKLVPDATLRKATCDYCGFTKLVEMKEEK